MEYSNELYRRTEECLSLFQDASEHHTLIDDDWFEDRAADFAWWSHGLKAQKTGRSSLDYRLRDRPDIRKVISGLLDGLALALKEHLQADKYQRSIHDDRENESDKSSSNSSWSEFSDETNQSKDKDAEADTPETEDPDPRFYIETNLKLLTKISIAIRRSGARLRYLKADMYLEANPDIDEYAQLRSHLLSLILVGPYEQRLFGELGRRAINQQIPKAVQILIHSWIVDPSRATSNQRRLIEANITRRNRIAYARRLIGNNALLTKRQETAAPNINPLQLPESMLGLGKESGTFGADAQEPFQIAEPIQLPPKAPELTESVAAKDLTATELGSQFVLPVIIPFELEKGATSIATRMTQTGIKQDYPACPCKKGSFQCPYCVQVLSEDYAVNSRWRGHVAQDLNPYSCIYQDCLDPHNQYATKEEWTKHMKSQHTSERWVCDDCTFESDQDEESIFESRELWESHMRCQHNCPDHRLTLLSSMSKRDLTKLAACPLCKRPSGHSRPDQDDHFAEHLHTWALRALPWDLNPDDEASSGSPEMGSENDLARMSEVSEHTEEEVDSIAATISDAVDREVTRWRHNKLTGPSRLTHLTKDLEDKIDKWTDRTRLDTQNEIMLQHLIGMNRTRAQFCRASQAGSEESEFTAQQQEDIELNLCTNMELGIEYMKGILGEDMEPGHEPSRPPFPKVNGTNIPLIDFDLLDGADSQSLGKRLIIAINFGTTYSSVSYVEIPEDCPSDSVDSRSICSISRYPESNDFTRDGQMLWEVPSEVIYPLDRHFRDRHTLIRSQKRLENEPGDEDQEERIPEVNNNGLLDAESLDDDGDTTMYMDVTGQFHWGYEVHKLQAIPAIHSDPTNLPLSRFKLLLDDSPMTTIVRQELNVTLDMLKSRRVVNGPLHVIADYLTYLLDHTRSELLRLGYQDSCPKEMVLCVPAIWSQQACRDMQKCLAVAMKKANFRGADVQNNSIENLFIVSEPEAAAAYMLNNSPEIRSGQTFILLDAGGGIVDANTYRVSNEEPLRLEHEVVPPGGGLHGSSYLNDDFKAYLSELLSEETYLEQGAQTINGIIERIMIQQFEPIIKRIFNVFQRSTTKRFVKVEGLRDNLNKGFQRGHIQISTSVIKRIFMRHLEAIFEIVRSQLDAALSSGCQVEKVVLIGGFGASISLRGYLEKRLAEYSQHNNCHVKLLRPRDRIQPVNAVSAGAVLRAMNKNDGPERISRSSYGILRAEPFGEYPEHVGMTPSYDKHDGLAYIKTIDWVLKLGLLVPSVWNCEPFTCSHTFDVWPNRPLICKEILYVSDHSTQSHYRLSHPKNTGAQKVGEIVVDFSDLREKGLKPVEPVINENGRTVGKRHYKVNFTIVIRVVDRDLRCYAIYNQQVKKKCRINIASSFRPGVR